MVVGEGLDPPARQCRVTMRARAGQLSIRLLGTARYRYMVVGEGLDPPARQCRVTFRARAVPGDNACPGWAIVVTPPGYRSVSLHGCRAGILGTYYVSICRGGS